MNELLFFMYPNTPWGWLTGFVYASSIVGQRGYAFSLCFRSCLIFKICDPNSERNITILYFYNQSALMMLN